MRRAVGRWWLRALAAGLVVVLHAAAPAQTVDEEPRPVAAPAAPAASQVPAGPVGGGLGEQVGALRLEVSELRAAVQAAVGGEAEPRWASAMRTELERRIERLAVMQERLAARIETPTPRLTEPIVLFTVAGCTLLFGFIIGRGAQRRSARRDSRLRL